MKASNIEDRLALVGALIVLFGVTFAAGDALGEDRAEITTTAVAIDIAAEDTLERAAKANADAAAQAAESLVQETSIDLDIKLGDHMSVLIAGNE
jgi:hypothetical protein